MRNTVTVIALVCSVSLACSQSKPSISPLKGDVKVARQFGVPQEAPQGGTRKHIGVDFAVADNTPVLATGDGSVVQAGESGKYGTLIKVKHAGGIQTLYAHLSAVKVKKGDHVKCGEEIGSSGHTGASQLPHLHYEVMVNGTNIDPKAYLP